MEMGRRKFQLLGFVYGYCGTNGVAQPRGVTLEAVEEAAGPQIFRSQHGESGKDGGPAGSRRKNHQRTQHQQSEAKHDLDCPLSLAHLSRPLVYRRKIAGKNYASTLSWVRRGR